MIPSAFRIRAIRGFQDEKEIPLSSSLTVIYGDNGRGKTSLCEGWHWLFTAEMREGLEPQSEVGDAGENIHVDLEPQARLIAEDEDLAVRSPGEFRNPASLPSSTSPVLLQYRLQQVLYTSQKDRRQFFEQVLELDVESEFAKKVRRACQQIDPYETDVWNTWQQAVDSVPDDEWKQPFPHPENVDQQTQNEKALLNRLSSYFGCAANPKSISEAIGSGSSSVDIPVDELSPPITEELVKQIEAARDSIDDLNAEAEQALRRAEWRYKGIGFVEPPRCPFCGEETVDKDKIAAIRAGVEETNEEHRTHRVAKKIVGQGIRVVAPLVELDLDKTCGHLNTVEERVAAMDIEIADDVASAVDDLRETLEEFEKVRPDRDELEDTDEFATAADNALELSRAWLALMTELESLEKELVTRRIRVQFTQCASSVLRYYDAQREEFYQHLEAQGALEELADAAPEAVERLKRQRLGRLADDIVGIYRILRPHDPTPLEEIKSAGGVRGDIRIKAKSQDKIEDASAIFSFSNANALGMAAHIARVLDAGHRTVVLDDPLQSLDASNRKIVVRDLVETLLDEGIQVVIATHLRQEAQELLDRYARQGAMGTQLRWDSENGAIPKPMYPDSDAQLEIALDGLERDDPSDIPKVSNALRQLIEGFCLKYLDTVGGKLPPSGRRNLGPFIGKLRGLPPKVRPNRTTVQRLKEWNGKLSREGHLAADGAEGMEELRAIGQKALKAQKEEKQLRPPNQDQWKSVPFSPGLKKRSKEILGVN